MVIISFSVCLVEAGIMVVRISKNRNAKTYHSNNKSNHEWSGKFATLVLGEDIGRSKRLLEWCIMFIKNESNQSNKARYQKSDYFGACRWQNDSIDDTEEDQQC